MTQKRNMVLFILLCFLLNKGYSQTDDYHFKSIPEYKGNVKFKKDKHYYVDGSASESGDGSKHSPFRTIQEAAEIMKAGDVCYISGGIYRETVRPGHSGSPEAPLVFRPEGDGKVVINGCERVDGWQSSGDRIYSTKIDLDLSDGNQVFADGRMMFEARWPNAGGAGPKYLLEFRMATMDEGTTTTRIVDDALPDIDWSGAKVWVSSNKRWFCWTGKVEGSGSGYIQVENNADDKGNQKCQKGGRYYLFGSESLLDTLNEYHYDRATGFLRVMMPDGGRPQGRVEVKKRAYAFDLRGVSYVKLEDLNIFGASIITDEDSRNITMDGLDAKYIHHSSRAVNQYGSQTRTGIILEGRDHTVTNSVIAYSSGNCLTLSGSNIHIINNYIHDANYIGSYASPVEFGRGCRNCIVSHNTITRAGRTIIGVNGFYASLLQYNDLSHAGYLTDDLGLTYGNGVEGGNSEVRYNWLHDNMADSHNMGLYFDHGCKNVIFHHNVIWGVDYAGMINNQYGNYLLYYNNTVSDARDSYRSAWAAGQKKDLYGCRIFNNIGTSVPQVDASGLEMSCNSWNFDKLRDNKFPAAGTEPVNSGIMIPGITDEYTGSKPDRGAYEIGLEPWVPGHNFEDPPSYIDTVRSKPPHRNLIKNAAFFSGDIKPWEAQGADVEITRDFHGQWESTEKAMMGGYSIKLGKGRNSLRQRIKGLKPGKTYEFMAKFRVAGGEEARLIVQEHGRPVRYGKIVSGNEPEWKMETVRFTTGKNHTTATIVLEKISAGEGMVYADDPGLRLHPLPVNQDEKNYTFMEDFSDEFNGEQLDQTKWNNDYNDWGQWSWEPYNAFTRDGMLHIRMEYNPHTRDGQKLWYKSGIIRSYDTIKYGYFEARIKGASKFPGVCPAFWAKGSKDGENAEIDFMEIQEVQNNIHQIDCNLHANRIVNGEMEAIHQRRHWIAPWDPRDDFHIYGCEWTADSIKWYIDNEHILSAPNIYWDIPMAVMASMAIRSPLRLYTDEGPKTNPEASTPEGFPTTMLVDYIRVWKESE